MPNLLEKFKSYIEPDGSESNDFLTEFKGLSNSLCESLEQQKELSAETLTSLKTLFDYRDDDGNTPLHLAVKNRDFTLVEAIVDFIDSMNNRIDEFTLDSMDIDNNDGYSVLEAAVNNFNPSKSLTEDETQIIFKLAYFGFEFAGNFSLLVGNGYEDSFFEECDKSMTTLLEEYDGIIDLDDGETTQQAIINTISHSLTGLNRAPNGLVIEDVVQMDIDGGDRGEER